MMSNRVSKISAVLCAAIATPAFAQQPTSQSNENIVVTGQAYDRKVVCRFEQNTGTRFATRTCHTNKEWDQMRERDMRAAQELINRQNIYGKGDGG